MLIRHFSKIQKWRNFQLLFAFMYSKLSDQIWLEFLTEQNGCTSFSFPHHPITWQASTTHHPDLAVPLHDNKVGWFVVCFWVFFFIRHFCRKFSTVVNMSEGQRCKICTRSKKADRSPLLPFHSCVEIPSASLKQGLDTMETRNLWRQTLKRIRRFLLNVVEK